MRQIFPFFLMSIPWIPLLIGKGLNHDKRGEALAAQAAMERLSKPHVLRIAQEKAKAADADFVALIDDKTGYTTLYTTRDEADGPFAPGKPAVKAIADFDNFTAREANHLAGILGDRNNWKLSHKESLGLISKSVAKYVERACGHVEPRCKNAHVETFTVDDLEWADVLE